LKQNQTPHKYGKVLRVSLPLVVSMATTMVMEFTDRIFLANYSLESIAAALPAGIAAFLFISFFTGTAGYVNVFIAQYTGASALHRVGAALWQGIYFAIFSGVMMAGLYFIAEPLFRFGGHSVAVQRLEVIYFRTLCLGAATLIVGTSLSCFYSGRGQTRPVMIFNMIGTLLNIPLDYALINGIWIFPELGILGAGIATVTSWTVVAVIFGVMIFSRENDRIYAVRKNRQFNLDLFRRLMKFGMPGALQFSMDIFGFTFFVFMVGRIGKLELAVSNIVLSIDSLAFMPLMGFSMGTSTLVGQALGRNCPDEAVSVTKATIHIVFVYIFFLALVFVFVPQMLLDLFRPDNLSAESYAAMRNTGVALLRLVVCYLFFDALYMICIGVLKGAGDTHFIMWSITITSLFVMILPIYIGIKHFGRGLYFAWICLTLFVFFLFILSFGRYLQGKWKHMRVIEKDAVLAEVNPINS
jgi:MATE family multidrug resistance protein